RHVEHDARRPVADERDRADVDVSLALVKFQPALAELFGSDRHKCFSVISVHGYFSAGAYICQPILSADFRRAARNLRPAFRGGTPPPRLLTAVRFFPAR